MGKEDEVLAAIEEAIIAAAVTAKDALSWAGAVRELAEARAWVVSERQPHGGSIVVQKG
jgi:hypothetical protein